MHVVTNTLLSHGKPCRFNQRRRDSHSWMVGINTVLSDRFTHFIITSVLWSRMHNVCWSTTTKSSVFHVTAFRWPCLFVCEYRLSCYSVLFYKRLYIQYKRLRVVGFAIYIVILYMFRKIAVRLFYSTVYGQICFKSCFPFPICEKYQSWCACLFTIRAYPSKGAIFTYI